MLSALWARVQGWLLMAGAVLLVLVGAYAAGGRAARRSAQVKQSGVQSEQRRKINEADAKLVEMGDDDVRRRLNEWVRPTDSQGD